VFSLFEELASKDYDRFSSVADLREDVRLAGAEREGKKKHTSACCDCDAVTNNERAQFALSGLVVAAWGVGVKDSKPRLLMKNLLRSARGVGVNKVDLL
jgi:hypothetical protein